MKSSPAWHSRPVERVLAELKTSPAGLSAGEADARLKSFGPNELEERGKRTPLSMLLGQFKDFMILVLIAAALVSGAVGDPQDAAAIAVIVALNAAMGFSQEYRAEKAMAALKKLAPATATVVREGHAAILPASRLVPGDILILQAGDVVPADLRLIEAVNLKAEEAALTGESVPVEKQAAELAGESLPIAERRNMAYKGTFITYGRGMAVVAATGMKTELGGIAAMLLDEKEVKTPLQKRLALFGRNVTAAVLAICAIVFIVGLIRGEPALPMFMTAVSLAVAAIPEALPAVITISLALGAQKMIRQNALIRKLPAVETLGSVTYICSDKTGTLTLNKMTLEEVWVDGLILKGPQLRAPPASAGTALELLFYALALSNDAKVGFNAEVLGDPTEAALCRAALAAGFDKSRLERRFPRLAELPFDSERKLMTTFHLWREGKIVAFTKGAVEALLERLEKTPSESPGKPGIKAATDRIAEEGLRTLGVAVRFWDALPEDLSPGRVENGLTMLGLAGLMDPPRPQARQAVELCRAAGIKPVMITGDHPLTARAVARRIGILEENHDQSVLLSGPELEMLPLDEFEERVEHVQVYARIAPEQKLKIVKALQDRGQFVAMTGDGVNDAPALKRADIGVAMGLSGTDVAKEAAHMVLLDDDFATIVKAVKEGRRIFDNIRKFVRFALTGNSAEIWTIFLAPFFGLPIPLLPVHILWINLVTDGLPGLALAAEPADPDVMRRPPRPPQESIFARGLGAHVVWVGLLMGAVCIITQAWSLTTGRVRWQTMVFTVLCLSQMGHVLAISRGPFSNKPLMGVFLLTFILQLATIYTPALNAIFKTSPLTPGELLLTLALSSVVFFAVELEKILNIRVWMSGPFC